MSESDIEEIIQSVRITALSRNPWLSNIRPPTEEEVKKAELFCELFPTKEQETDRTVTVVISYES